MTCVELRKVLQDHLDGGRKAVTGLAGAVEHFKTLLLVGQQRATEGAAAEAADEVPGADVLTLRHDIASQKRWHVGNGPLRQLL